MKVLIIGSGGREHALAWKIAQSPLVSRLYCAPGNGGTLAVAENLPIMETDIAGLLEFAVMEKIDLTVVGPELPLSAGIVDEFEKRGLRIFGPSKRAAELESSKVFAKKFMERHKIPTGRFKIAETHAQALKILKSGEFAYPLVIKADGLAAGKGAVVCNSPKKAEDTAREMLVDKKFGDAGKRIVIEEFLRGRELSFIVVSDGTRVQPLVTTMDHKAAYDGDTGPNTGGMGAISPSPFVGEALLDEIMETIVYPTVTRMLEEGRKLKGVLYAGLMLTSDGPKVLEYNCRFGDPETQPQMLRLESDLLDLIIAACNEDILRAEVVWNRQPSACVVVASGGYPFHYEKGKMISGLPEAMVTQGITIFHAGTRLDHGVFYTNGGRVAGVCASEPTLGDTLKVIYETIQKIYFEGMHYRHDIGAMKEDG